MAPFGEVCGNYKVCGRLHNIYVNVLMVFRDDLTTLLTKAGSGLTVKALMDNLQETIEFETSMAKKWATPVCPFSFISHASLLIEF